MFPATNHSANSASGPATNSILSRASPATSRGAYNSYYGSSGAASAASATAGNMHQNSTSGYQDYYAMDPAVAWYNACRGYEAAAAAEVGVWPPPPPTYHHTVGTYKEFLDFFRF
jgi:hypothetical protein